MKMSSFACGDTYFKYRAGNKNYWENNLMHTYLENEIKI